MYIPHKKHHLCVFDFDDTLIFSESHVVKCFNVKTNKAFTLSTNEWEHHQHSKDEQYDFSEFENIGNPHKVEKVWNIFNARLANKDCDVVILSARSKTTPVYEFFLKSHSRHLPYIVCLGISPNENNGVHKARWISEEIHKANPSFVEFYDDRDDNIREVKHLRKVFPEVTFAITQVKNGNLVSF